MKIHEIQVIIRPDEIRKGMTHLDIRVETRERVYGHIAVIDNNHFNSSFDDMIDLAKEQIKRAVKEQIGWSKNTTVKKKGKK